MNKFLYCLFCILVSNVYAISTSTTIESGVTLYSEYYPNPKAKFTGTIIFENASGTSLGEWTSNTNFLNCANRSGSLFFYDHNGLGYSPPDLHVSGNNPITGSQINDKLLKLLKQNHVKPPYIVVSHSYGGLFAGYFSLKNPSLVKGMLMIDPAPKNYLYTDELLNKFEPTITKAKNLPASYIYLNFSNMNTEAAYLLLGFETTKHQVSSLGNINNQIPVIIASSTSLEKSHPIKEDWYNSQKQWLNNNPHSKIFQVQSGHFIQIEQPQLICNELQQLVNLIIAIAH